MEENKDMNNTAITNGPDIEENSNSAENAVNENTEKFEKSATAKNWPAPVNIATPMRGESHHG